MDNGHAAATARHCALQRPWRKCTITYKTPEEKKPRPGRVNCSRVGQSHQSRVGFLHPDRLVPVAWSGVYGFSGESRTTPAKFHCQPGHGAIFAGVAQITWSSPQLLGLVNTLGYVTTAGVVSGLAESHMKVETGPLQHHYLLSSSSSSSSNIACLKMISASESFCALLLCWPLSPHSCFLSLAWGSFHQGLQHQRVHTGGLRDLVS